MLTITSVSPVVGHTAGQTLVEIRGTGFRVPILPQPNGMLTVPARPTVEVLFGSAFGSNIAVVSAERLFVRAPISPHLVRAPTYGEGVVDVVVRNLNSSGIPIAGEIVTIPGAYSYRRVQLADESDLSRVVRTLIQSMRLQVIDNVSINTDPDFDSRTSDDLNVVDVATVPAVVIFGPTIQENRFFSTNGLIYRDAPNDEADAFSGPDTDDLIFTFVGITNNKQEALNLLSVVRQYFKRNRWLYMQRDLSNEACGYVGYDLILDPGGMTFNSPTDQKSNLKTFSGTFTIRGFDHEQLAGFVDSDRRARLHKVTPTPIPPPPDPAATTKAIVTFTFPDGIGTIGNGTISVRVPFGTDLSALVPTITHTGASISPPSGQVRDFTSPVHYTVTAVDGSTRDYQVTVSVAPAATDTMKIGTNFWYHAAFSGETSMKTGINWLTAYGAATNGLADTNIWNETFLAELAPYVALRFMDWANINWSPEVSWSTRRLPTDDNSEVYIDGLSTTDPNPGIAYEWMIDICNRLQKDLWVCIPAKADAGYWTQLATLIHAKLQPALKVYVEYSNETWNDQFGQKQYTLDQGVALDLPGGNEYYKGQSFVVLQSLHIFDAFESVFGADQMGSRVVRVFAYGGNTDTGRQALRDVYVSTTYNTTPQIIDMLAFAPYIGSSLDGASPTIRTEFHATIDSVAAVEVAQAVADIAEFSIPKLGAYEGGQHLLLNSQMWSMNPYIYDEYRYMLDKWSESFALFMHYTHTAAWTNDAGKSSWGALDHTGQASSEAHKYRALVDWALANP